MLKKILLPTLVLMILIPTAVYAATFKDVLEDHLNYKGIEYLKEKNALNGYPDGFFRPDQKVNRVEALRIILEGLDYFHADPNVKITADGLIYTDILQEGWYVPYLKKANDDLIVSGYEDKLFKPGQFINLAEALKIIILTNKIKVSDVPITDKPYPDVEGTSWFAKFVQYAKDKNVISPQNDGLLHPEMEITRGALVEIIYRLRKIKENNWDKYDLTENWPEYNNLEQFYKIKYPKDWIVIKNGKNTIFWKKQEDGKQIDYIREFPNSATVSVMLFNNEEGLTKEQYIEQIKTNFNIQDFVAGEKKVNGDLPALTIAGSSKHEDMIDLLIYLPNKQILTFHGSYGKGYLSEYLKTEINALLDSFVFLPNGGVDINALKEQARKNIAVDKKGKETLNLFADKELLTTDSIGVGTGPVDYYFSQEANFTMKFERSLDVILAISEGETTAF